MSSQNCIRHLMAQGAVSQVEYCAGCGVFHVSMESITVRFRPTALRDLRDTLCAALADFPEPAAAERSEAQKRLQ